jgi:hypothetical protein
MAKHRALAPALLIVPFGAATAMFACRGPDSAEYSAMGTSADDASPSGPPDASSEAAADAHAGDDALFADDSQVYSSYPLSRCAIGKDVFYLDVQGPSGPLQLGEITETNAGANWFVALQPELNIMLETETGPVGSVQVWTPDSTPVVPGTYPQGPSNKGPSIDVVVVEEGCQLSSGSFTLLDLQYDWPDTSTSGDVSSLLLSFDLVCGDDTVRGCIRYSE